MVHSVTDSETCSAARCTSTTAKGHRCSRWTDKGHKCAQHLQLDDGLRIAPSCIPGAGWGLFTTVARRKGGRVAEYAGKRVTLAVGTDNGRYGGEYVLQISRTTFIDAASTSSGAGRYSNTARAYNVARKECRGNNAHFTLDRRAGTAWITATKPMRPGEEVYTAYGRAYCMQFPRSPTS